MSAPPVERIVAAALRMPNGTVLALAPPARHHNLFDYAAQQGYSQSDVFRADQGFVTSWGRWARRAPALRIAQKAGQVAPCDGRLRDLYSDDLW